MQYQTTQTVLKVIKPSETYAGRVTREEAYKTLLGHHVEAFRPPQLGEYYLGKTNKIVRRGHNDNYSEPGPRLIVTIPTPSYWE